MPETEPTPFLWEQIRIWARRRDLPLEAVASPHTRVKIRRGGSVRDDVYERIERTLGWETGDAKRAEEQGIPPRPVEGDAQDAAAERVEVMRTLGDAVGATPGATEAAVKRARLLAEEILRTLRTNNA